MGFIHPGIDITLPFTQSALFFCVFNLGLERVDGDRSLLWQLENAIFPESFEFSDIIKTTQISRVFTKPGKSAFIVEKSSEMQKMLARFYKIVAVTTKDRKMELFYSEKEVINWLGI